MSEKRKAPPHAWQPGQSGNPLGKPRGARNKATEMVMAILQGGADDVASTVLQLARKGDLSAAKIVLDRLVPPARETTVNISLPDTDTAAGVARAQAALLKLAADGELTPAEASTLAGIVEQRRRALETEELERRIQALEAK